MIPGIISNVGLATPAAVSAAGSLDTQTVTVGGDGTAVNSNRRRGFIIAALGSCATGNSALYSGAVIREIANEEDSSQASDWNTVFTVTGVVANSGWSTMTVSGTPNITLNRASASFSTAGGNSTWTWTNTPNLMGIITGAGRTVGFS